MARCSCALGLATALMTVSVAACSADPAPGRLPGTAGMFDNPAGGAGGTTGGTGGVASVGVVGGQGGLAAVGGTSGMGVGGNVCDADVYTGERKRLDIYMMIDDSASMIPWWPATIEAISMFWMDPGSAGIGIGEQFFGENCDPSYYATPRVPIAALPDNLSPLEMGFPLFPAEGTATLPAMQGAITHAREWVTTNPDAKTIVLLVTDGLPDDCESTVENVSAAIAEGFNGSPSIQTFVIGLGDLGALNMFAMAGGTNQAIVIEPGAAPALVEALNRIRTAALPCDFALPDGNGVSSVTLDKVNLQYTDTGGAQTTIPNVPDAASCEGAAGGWFYDMASGATRLVACPQSCDQLNTGGEVQVVLGCPTVKVQ
jgi:hypothetical protein